MSDEALAQISPERAFWNWFVQHEEMLWDFKQDRERIFDLLHEELHKVDENLAFEFSSPCPKREFIISAEGNRESFPAVIRLQDAAPVLPRWELIAFRPRRWPSGTIRTGELEIKSSEMSFSLFSKANEIGLRLFLPHYSDENASMKMIAYLFLDEALGEFDMETKVRFLKFASTEDSSVDERHPFEELPVEFDKLYAMLNGLSGKPSEEVDKCKPPSIPKGSRFI